MPTLYFVPVDYYSLHHFLSPVLESILRINNSLLNFLSFSVSNLLSYFSLVVSKDVKSVSYNIDLLFMSLPICISSQFP